MKNDRQLYALISGLQLRVLFIPVFIEHILVLYSTMQATDRNVQCVS